MYASFKTFLFLTSWCNIVLFTCMHSTVIVSSAEKLLMRYDK